MIRIFGKNTVFLLLTLFIGLENVYACMYGPPYKTVCEVYNEANSVIIGKIIELKNENAYQQVVKIKVNKTFKGEKKKEIILYQPLSTCDWDFSDSEGETLLLYLHKNKKTGRYSAIPGGMGGRVEKENENLYWLNNLPKSLKRTRISGTVELYQDEPFEFVNYVIGTKIKIFNDKNSYEVFADKNGVYELWDIPIGKYKITPSFPKDYMLKFSLSRGLIDFKKISDVQVDTEDFTVEIQQNGCGGSDYILNKPKG
jgi:hypothetical protein